MPIQKLNFRPGVNTQLSKTANEGGWSDSNLIRFRDGLPQKIGGWVSFLSTAITGIARAVWTWQQLDSSLDIAFGTHNSLILSQGGAVFDITPLRRSAVLTSPFTTSVGSAFVTVVDAGHSAVAGDLVVVVSAAAVGGITLAGTYSVAVVVDANTYTILAASGATSSATGGGSTTLSYPLQSGNINAVQSNGVGVGLVGIGTVGTPRSGSLLTLGIRTWALVNWGELLLGVVRYGMLYVWGTSVTTRATQVLNSTPANGPPLTINSMFIGMPERHCILLGTSALNSSNSYDPMLVRFSDVETFDSYLASATNSAGSFRLQGGTQLICGLNITNQSVIWSDAAMFSMRFIGLPYVYGFDRLGTGCGIIGPHAMAEQSGLVFWMGVSAFYAFRGGAPETIPCPVWQTVFSSSVTTSVNLVQADKVYCGISAQTNEVYWFYPSLAGVENDRFVAYNFVENLWHFGAMARTTWIDKSVVRSILATDPVGGVYQHETGVDANGNAMDSYVESGYLDIGDGTEFMFVDKVIPDFGNDQVGTVYVTIKTVDYPNSAPLIQGPFAMTPTTQFLSVRARARQIAFRFETLDAGAYFRLGAIRVQAAQDGRR